MMVYSYSVWKELMKNMEQWISTDKIKEIFLVKAWKFLYLQLLLKKFQAWCKKYNDVVDYISGESNPAGNFLHS